MRRGRADLVRQRVGRDDRLGGGAAREHPDERLVPVRSEARVRVDLHTHKRVARAVDCPRAE
eukprot:2885358-Pleurochrysis_carterae.AAC.1